MTETSASLNQAELVTSYDGEEQVMSDWQDLETKFIKKRYQLG